MMHAGAFLVRGYVRRGGQLRAARRVQLLPVAVRSRSTHTALPVSCMNVLINTTEGGRKDIRWVAGFVSQRRKLSGAVCHPKGWAPEEVPNPKTGPHAAGRIGIVSSNVCDPDRILSKESQDVVEGYIKKIPHETVAVVLRKMALTGASCPVDREKAAGIFARRLHDTWGVGDKSTNDGIVLLLSVEDRVVFVSTGRGVTDTLDAAAIDGVIAGMKPYLQKGDYGGAVEYGVLAIEDICKGGGRYSNSDTGKFGRFASTTAGIALLFALLEWFSRRSTARKVKKAEKALPQLFEGDDVSCPYCLESYETSKASRVTAECGHSFCRPCFDELCRVGGADTGTCVVCAEPFRLPVISPDMPVEIPSAVADDSVFPDRDRENADYRVSRYLHKYDSVLHLIDLEAIIRRLTEDKVYTTKQHEESISNLRKKHTERVRERMESQKARDAAAKEGSKGSGSQSMGGGSSSGGGGGGGSW